ncbi:hypothetical protein ACT80S_18390 [Ramlibacter sp. MAHUQ-53]|uniref:hypothetical protein n=1 Tax=unclassified Ramlibacter TaxID=2617605 RepID=UPI0036395666
MTNEFMETVFTACGGRQVVIDSLGISKQALSGWKRAGYVPSAHAVAIERLSGIPRSRLCPAFDWGDDHKHEAAAEPA